MAGSRVVPLCQENRPACSVPMDVVALSLPGVLTTPSDAEMTRIFDPPGFRSGWQVLGFVDRASRELAVSLIAQLRRCWYLTTHHAILGRQAFDKLGLSERQFAAKWSTLADRRRSSDFTPIERAVLDFAEAFATDPKSYGDDQYRALRQALADDSRERFATEGLWLARREAARLARAAKPIQGLSREETQRAYRAAATAVSRQMPNELNDRCVNAQVVELAILCRRFVTLGGVFSALNVPDEPSLAHQMQRQLPDVVIQRINTLNHLGPEQMADLIPPPVDAPLEAIVAGKVRVEPAHVGDRRLARVPCAPHGRKTAPAPHPDLVRFEIPDLLPLLFDDEQREHGTGAANAIPRRLKELVIRLVHCLTRCRYGLEHHTPYFCAAYAKAGRATAPFEREAGAARERATQAALHVLEPRRAPAGVFSELEIAALDWVGQLVVRPHDAYRHEPALRAALTEENARPAPSPGRSPLRRSPRTGTEAALKRLVDHQIAELAVLAGQFDGWARALSILRLHAAPSTSVAGNPDDPRARHDAMRSAGVDEAVVTFNELLVNPALAEEINRRLGNGEQTIQISGEAAAATAEF